MAVREVAFELECFEWAEERLEVAGRWKGLPGRRLARPVLSIDTGTGRRKRLVALPGGKLGAAEETWHATFDWPGDPAEIIGAELEVGGSVAVDLPLPDRRRRRRKRPAPDPADETLRNEAVALRGQIERLRAELAGRERENMQLRAQLDEEPEEEPAAVAEAGAATVEIERLASEREQLTVELARLAGERDKKHAELSAEAKRLQGELRETRERSQRQIDDLREAIAEAAAEAEVARDRERAALAALQQELDAERAKVAGLTIELAERPALPGPATESARAAAAAPRPPSPSPSVPPPGAAPTDPAPTEPASEPPPTERMPAFLEAASLPGVLDPPGPLRAGSRPAEQPGLGARLPGWLRAGRGSQATPADTGEEQSEDATGSLETAESVGEHENGTRDEGRTSAPGAASLQALKARLEQLFAPNGNAVAAEESGSVLEEPTLPGPRRSATAARARAGASVAARRNPAEVWGLRILALVLVAVLLVAFLLLLTSIA